MKKTDIPEPVLDVLSRSQVKKVKLIGRRGPYQVAFTIKELREMIKLPECKLIINKKYFDNYKTKLPGKRTN